MFGENLRVTFPLVAAVTLLGASACGSSGSHPSTTTQPQPTQRTDVITQTAVGDLVTTAEFAKAQELFGVPYSETQSSTDCIARWQGGLTIAWHRELPEKKWTKACLKFSSAKVTGKNWRTDKGLRVGAAQAAIERLYPHAAKKKAGTAVYWNLNPKGNPSLQAWMKHGRIKYFQVVRL
jgi:hypothetical protein